jgi:excisionase family DNA binding protein
MADVSEPLILSREEAARVMGVSLPTIDKWIRDDGTAFVEEFGGNGRPYRINAEKLKAWRDGRVIEEEKAEEKRRELLNQLEIQFTGGAVSPGESGGLTADHRIKLLNEQLLHHKVRRERGELVEASRAELAHETRLKLVADFLRGLPDVLARRMSWDPNTTKACAEQIEGLQERLARTLMEERFLD